MSRQRTISPIDDSVVSERDHATDSEVASLLAGARHAHGAWKHTTLAERASICTKMVDAFVADAEAIADEITAMMGRPRRYSAGEVRGFEERARHMIAIAPSALADVHVTDKPGFRRLIRHESIGVVFVVAPWNYPYLTAVNAIVPAIMAGNVVVLKHSAQTPMAAERLRDAFVAAGAPEGVFQVAHLSHDTTQSIIGNGDVDFVCFTGSVEGGRAVERSAAGRFIGLGLELGGKDPAYVRADADLELAVESLVDGAFFNSGQSCCGIERIYVHASRFDAFVERAVALTKQYVLGDPRAPETTLGPMVRTSAATFVRDQIAEAVAAGARAHLDEASFPKSQVGTPYLAPQILTGVDHSMRVMTEESFGPVVGIMPVRDDDEAVALMNDSRYGLTACIFTTDVDAASRVGDRLETGTVFMNRCDYLDPALAWTGVKESGRGCTLSTLGYAHLTRPKSFHFKLGDSQS